MFSLARSVSVKHESDRTLFPADSISPFPGESSTEIPPFSPDVIFLVGSINWSVTQNGIIAEIYSVVPVKHRFCSFFIVRFLMTHLQYIIALEMFFL